MKKLMVAMAAAGFLFAGNADAKLEQLKITGKVEFGGYYDDNTSDYTNTTGDNNSFYWADAEVDFKVKMSDGVSARISIENANDGGTSQANGNSFPVLDEDEDTLEVKYLYITAKEFFYKPLTVTMGLQKFEFSLRGDGHDALTVEETIPGLKLAFGFDNIDLTVWTGVEEEGGGFGTAGTNTDEDEAFYGINLDYWVEKNLFNGGIYVREDRDGAVPASFTQFYAGVDYFVNENLELYAELAVQNGDSVVAATTDQDALAYRLGGMYSWKNSAYKPWVDLSWESYSGDGNAADNDNENFVSHGDHDLANFFILTDDQLHAGSGAINSANSASNSDQIRLWAGLQASKEMGMRVGYLYHAANDVAAGTQDELGSELNLLFDYQYSQDLMFAWGAGWYFVDSDTNHFYAAARGTNVDDAFAAFWYATLNF